MSHFQFSLAASNHKIEAAVLGSMLQVSEAVDHVITFLRGNDEVFNTSANRIVYRAITALHEEGQAVDLLTVSAWLEKRGLFAKIGGYHYLAGLLLTVQSSARLHSHCLELLELYAKRKISHMAYELFSKAKEATVDPHELLSEAQIVLNRLHDSLQIRQVQTVANLFDAAIDRVVKATQTPDGITGVATGLKALDKITGGFQPSNLIIIAARPSMGKTSLGLAMARMAASNPDPCLFVSLEMSANELVTKLIATETAHSPSQLCRGAGMNREQAEALRTDAAALRQLPIIIDDTPGLSIGEFRAKATKAKQEHGIKWIIVDYLQLMTGEKKGGNREQEISSISRGLKLVAKELNIPIVALCQLSRSPELRGGDKRPILSDMRESGAIEQDADVVIFPYRPEYYKITSDADGNSVEGITELIIAKHRNGPLATLIVQSDMKTGKYQDIAPTKPANTESW